MEKDTVLKCPRDNNVFSLMYESERLDNTIRIVVYYKCPVCKYRVDLERLELLRGEHGIVVKRTLYPQRSLPSSMK